MAASQGTALALLTLFVSIFILAISGWDLFLSHYKEERSDVDILAQERNSTPEFTGGNHAIDESAFWRGTFYLKLVNSGNKGSYINTVNHELLGLKRDGQIHDIDTVSVQVNENRSGWAGDELEPHSSKQYRAHVRIETDTDIRPFIEHDSAVIQHNLTVEDDQGSYDVTHTTEIGLSGPDQAREKWFEKNL